MSSRIFWSTNSNAASIHWTPLRASTSPRFRNSVQVLAALGPRYIVRPDMHSRPSSRAISRSSPFSAASKYCVSKLASLIRSRDPARSILSSWPRPIPPPMPAWSGERPCYCRPTSITIASWSSAQGFWCGGYCRWPSSLGSPDTCRFFLPRSTPISSKHADLDNLSSKPTNSGSDWKVLKGLAFDG